MRRSLSALGSIAAGRRASPSVVRVANVAVMLIGVLAAVPIEAQSTGNGFLFQEPKGSIALRAGFAQARGASDIFAFVIDELTLGRGDFAGVSVATDLSVRLNSRLDLVVGSSYSGSNARSEFRDFVDNNDQPIEQTTGLARVPLTASAKFYLTSPGHSIGHYAWIPAKLAPFVGAGGGAMWYRFRQQGDFIDPDTYEVFTDSFRSDGWTPVANAFAGLDVSLGPRFGVTGEGRYLWARAPMSRDFSNDFDRIDLSGFNASVGLYVRF